MSAESDNPNRRQFMRLAGTTTLGAGAAYYGGTQYVGSPVQRGQAVPPLAIGIAAAAGVGYVIGTVNDHFSGLGDSGSYSDKQEEQLYYQGRQDAELIKTNNDRTLTQANNLLANAKSVAYQIGRAKFIERLNAGDDIPVARTAAKGDITGYFVSTQKNVVERWDVMMLNVELAFDRANALGVGSSWIINTEEDSKSIDEFRTNSYGLLDGSSIDYRYPYSDYPPYGDRQAELSLANRGGGYIDTTWLVFTSNTDYGYSDSVTLLNDSYSEWQSLLNGIKNKHDEATAELDAFADGIKDQYVAGEISTEDLVTPRDLWEMSSDDAENPYAAADLAGLGLEVNQSSSMTVQLLDGSEPFEATVYLSKSPVGGSLTAGSVYDPTLSVQYQDDGSGGQEPISYDGTESDPIPLDGLTYFAYNTDSGESTYAQIQQPFTLIEATDENGNNLNQVGYEPAVGQQTTTTDVDELRSELQTMNDEINRLEEERRETATGSGGGVDLSNLSGFPSEVVVVVVAAVAAFLFAK